MNEIYDNTWYNDLKKPAFQPPTWVFAPVWTVLYLLIILSFVLILFSPFELTNIVAYVLFVIQLILNLSWSTTFFKFHNIERAFLICLVLTITVFFMIPVFYFISKLAAGILLPYLLWLIFASYLNFSIMKLNKGN